VILGLSVYTFVLLHVALSLVAIASGVAALLVDPLGSPRAAVLAALFLASTLATSVTGFFFPSAHLGPGHVTGTLTLVTLVPTALALYRHRLAGPWRQVYGIGAAVALYLNVFIAVLQAFGKIPLLPPLAPTLAAAPLLATQLVVLALFVALFVLAARRPH